MKNQMTQAELNKHIALHAEYLSSNGKKGVRFDIRDACMQCLVFDGADLRDCIIQTCDCNYSVIRKVNLSGAQIYDTSFEGADFCDSVLCNASMIDSNLSRATFRGTSCSKATFVRDDARGTVWNDAILTDCVFTGTNLVGADFQHASLVGADFDYATLPLWCGMSHLSCSPSLVRQLFAHILTWHIEGADDSMNRALAAIQHEAALSHRAKELGVHSVE